MTIIFHLHFERAEAIPHLLDRVPLHISGFLLGSEGLSRSCHLEVLIRTLEELDRQRSPDSAEPKHRPCGGCRGQ